MDIDLLDITETNSFDDNIILAKEWGFIALHIPWSSIESSPNNFTDPYDAIFLLGKVAIFSKYGTYTQTELNPRTLLD